MSAEDAQQKGVLEMIWTHRFYRSKPSERSLLRTVAGQRPGMTTRPEVASAGLCEAISEVDEPEHYDIDGPTMRTPPGWIVPSPSMTTSETAQFNPGAFSWLYNDTDVPYLYQYPETAFHQNVSACPACPGQQEIPSANSVWDYSWPMPMPYQLDSGQVEDTAWALDNWQGDPWQFYDSTTGDAGQSQNDLYQPYLASLTGNPGHDQGLLTPLQDCFVAFNQQYDILSSSLRTEPLPLDQTHGQEAVVEDAKEESNLEAIRRDTTHPSRKRGPFDSQRR
ncbi:hypothetical protein E4U42_003163, partial [Claviceps africana]